MKANNYFIDHPVVTIILNCLITIVGLLCLQQLSVREYPAINFPTITVRAIYPNASPDLVETAVTNVLEDQLAGIEGLDTITSQSMTGQAQINLLFHSGISMDKAVSSAQDAVNRVSAFLPTEVKTPTVERQKKSSGLPFIAIAIESNSMGFGELTHFVNLNIKNAFRSIPGVAVVSVWGQPYTYAIQLDPQKLFSFGINADEVIRTLAKNRGALPSGNYRNEITSTLEPTLITKDDYENLLIQPQKGAPVHLKSLATVTLTTDDESMRVRINHHAGLILAIDRANDANPLEVSAAVQQVLTGIQANLPNEVKTKVIIDQSNFINASLKNIRSSIGEAIVLVLCIVFLFLRNFRATLIPLITIPISLLGAFIFLKLFGYSLNLMTLLAMVLAIGLVVDDAIVVLENISRHIEKGLSPLEAARKGSREINFAIIAMTCTLVSVYLPIAFIPGMLGQFFIEFAVSLAGSVIISGIVALTLSPLMCANLLKPKTSVDNSQVTLWAEKWTDYYATLLFRLFAYPKTIVFLALISLGLSIFFYYLLPHEIAPKEDRGLIGIYIPSTTSKNLNTLDKMVKPIEQLIRYVPEANNQVTFLGEWGANTIIPLKAHKQRQRTAQQIIESLNPLLTHYPSIDPLAWSWDTALPGLDNAGSGSELSLIVSGPDSFRQLFVDSERLKKALDASKQFAATSFELRLDSLGYTIKLDQNQISRLGITNEQIAKTIEVFFSGDKSQSFEKDGIIYTVTVKGKIKPWTLDELYLTNAQGKRISLGAIATMTPKAQPDTLEHFQQMRATTFHIQLEKGKSIPKAMMAVWRIAKAELPASYKLTWSGAAKSVKESSNTLFLLLFLSLVFIYAILALQFENFIDPLIILFTVPLACCGGLLVTYLSGQSFNIYTQVGLVTLMGLISKHGILIVEFANQLYQQGKSIEEAVHTAALLRLRPIVMTTGAMIFGTIPLILSTDAGSEARHALGTVLVGGLSLGTLFTLFVLPILYARVKQIISPFR